MPILSAYARKRKLDFFIPFLPKDARILEAGAGDGWLGRELHSRGWFRYQSLDFHPAADFQGDINRWPDLGILGESFDVIIAFEVVEHGDFYQAFYDMLRPGGLLFLTTPVPPMDWILKLLEAAGLNQKRTSPHSHLHDIRSIPGFEPLVVKRVAFLSQWGVFRKTPANPTSSL